VALYPAAKMLSIIIAFFSESHSPLPPPLDSLVASFLIFLFGVAVFGVGCDPLDLRGVDGMSGLPSVSEADEIGEDGISDELCFILCCLSRFSLSYEWNSLCTNISSSDGSKIGSTDATRDEELRTGMRMRMSNVLGLVNRTLTTDFRL